MSDDKETDTIEIDETVEESTEQEFSIEGLSDGEVELAKEHGLYKEKEEGVEVEEVKEGESKEEVKEEEEIENPTFEQVEENEKLIEKYDRNSKALYWKWKTGNQKVQSFKQDLVDKGLASIDPDSGKFEIFDKSTIPDIGVSSKKLDAIKELLKDPDSLTIESLQAALDEEVKVEEVDNSEAETKSLQNKISTKSQFAEKIGSAKYDNFEGITQLAKEIMAGDKYGTYQKIIDDAFTNDFIDENMLVEQVVNIARLSPKFNEVVNQVDPEGKKKVDRALNNSKKKVSSASVSGASGKRIISESELTVAQAENLSPQKWNKLKETTKKRILMGIDP